MKKTTRDNFYYRKRERCCVVENAWGNVGKGRREDRRSVYIFK